MNAQLLALAELLAAPAWPPGTAPGMPSGMPSAWASASGTAPGTAPGTAEPPAPPHPDTLRIGGRLARWAETMGLVLGDPDACPLGRARFERLAGRIFPGADADRVELAARWLLWFFALDDAIDETPLGGSATSVHDLHESLGRALRRGHARPEARPLEVALVDLWGATAPEMGRAWRRRFLAHLDEHRAGCAAEAVNRRTGRTPGLADHPSLRRRAGGPFLYDLAEPVLGAELPAALGAGGPWTVLVTAIADIVTWTNDIVSHSREAARGDPHNQVAVVMSTYGFEPAQAAGWVVEYIADRVADMRAAARVLDRDLDRRTDAGPVERTVRCLLGVPRAHLDWLLESGRYTGRLDPPGVVPRGPVPPRGVVSPRTSASPASVRT